MRIHYIACAALLVAAACSRTPRMNVDPGSGRVDVDVERTGSRGQEWNAQLRPVAGTNMSGSAQAMVSDDMTDLQVMVAGANSGGSHPWHVHEGRCGSGGPMVGQASAYPPLQPGRQGRAEGGARLADVELNEAKSYYVDVHASESSAGTILACGNLDD